MSSSEFKLDQKGIGEILRGAPMAAAVDAAAQSVAAELRSRGAGEVYVDHYVTDRTAAAVRIASSAGDELKRGRLLDAASAAGLDVRGRS